MQPHDERVDDRDEEFEPPPGEPDPLELRLELVPVALPLPDELLILDPAELLPDTPDDDPLALLDDEDEERGTELDEDDDPAADDELLLRAGELLEELLDELEMEGAVLDELELDDESSATTLKTVNQPLPGGQPG